MLYTKDSNYGRGLVYFQKCMKPPPPPPKCYGSIPWLSLCGPRCGHHKRLVPWSLDQDTIVYQKILLRKQAATWDALSSAATRGDWRSMFRTLRFFYPVLCSMLTPRGWHAVRPDSFSIAGVLSFHTPSLQESPRRCTSGQCPMIGDTQLYDISGRSRDAFSIETVCKTFRNSRVLEIGHFATFANVSILNAAQG